MKTVVLGFLIAGLALSKAAAVDLSQPLTWEDCIALAARGNFDLQSALAFRESTRAQYKGSYNGILPQVNLVNSYSETRRVAGVYTLGGTASLDLIDLGQWANIQSSLAAYKGGQANVRVASSNALLALYRAFTGLMYAQEAISVNTIVRDTWKTNAQMVNLRYQSGSESKGNNMNTQAQLLQAESDLDQASRTQHVSQQELSQAIGQEDFNALVVTGTWSAAQAPRPRPDFTRLLEQNPRIQAQEAVVDQARAGIKSAHSTLWPTLSLNYSRGTLGGSEFPNNPFWTFGGVVNYPLFAGGPTATYYASAAAEHAYDKAKLDLRSLRSQALSDLESAWANYAQAEDQVRVQHAFLNAAKQRKDESDVRYQSGLMTFDNWIIVIQDYANFQQSFLRAQQNLILAEAQWRFASGEQL